MDVYRAVRDFHPSSQRGAGVLTMRRGEEFDILTDEVCARLFTISEINIIKLFVVPPPLVKDILLGRYY